MRLHAIQHVPFETPGLITAWAEQHDAELTTSLALTEEYPPLHSVDLLVVLGGPMDADDEVASPWLVAEKRFVRDAIDAGMPVLGICLGAQIVAEVIGGTVRRAEEPEIGWFPVGLTPYGCSEPLFGLWPAQFIAGHWHFDTYDLPAGVEPVLSSDGCRNQAFVYRERVVGLQFHLEWTPELLEALVDECGRDLPRGTYIQDPTAMVADAPLFAPVAATLLFELLDSLAGVELGAS